MASEIQIDDYITVGALAELLTLPASKLIAELLKNGVLATVNEKIDYETAQIIVGELEVDVELTKKEHAAPQARVKRESSESAKARPPVVAMMGHVDHGKTSLMDAIREAEVVKSEAGGITQHLSAYQVERKGRVITLLDTPGHEAFASLREHGARLTDLVILVVAADDGVKPQTKEAIRFARQAGVKIVVAANKMDKPGADLNRLKQQLSENELMPEDWGGETVVVPVSAKNKDGLDELLDMVLLVTDIEELKADTEGPAEGLIIEAHMEKGRGPVAVALVEQGTLNPGDFMAVGGTYGKVRNLEATTGKPLKSAGPSTPVLITGLKALPEFADQFEVVSSEKQARGDSGETGRERRSGGVSTATSSSELLRIITQTNKLNELNVVVKADVQGSLTSVIDSLKGLATDEVAVRVVSSGVGIIKESDVHTATTSGAIIYGFNVSLPTNIKRLALRDKVPVRMYSVIYELLDDVRKELETRLVPEVVEEKLGELIVKGVFKITKTETICGGEVSEGTLKIPALARLYRSKKLLADNLEVVNLKRGPQDVKEVPKGEMCGLSLKTVNKLEVVENDRLELFRVESKTRTL
ncbi:translation initiation factor IF-2 [Candidatus Saccharibacteria bacterium]|nr:translation initiation factor IF-2 [Candidatus Saccharibacteria bacterium]